MHVLVVGGTQFIGRVLVKHLLRSGHTVTLFNRGITAPDLFTGRVTKLVGDRRVDLSALNGGTWDTAVDLCGYTPREVASMLQVLTGKVKKYIFISTTSVYRVPCKPEGDEEMPLRARIPDSNADEAMYYSEYKVLCEAEVIKYFEGDSLILRLGVVTGPYDPTDRVAYWVARISRGGDVLVPGEPEAALQVLDVHDLARFINQAIIGAYTGILNVSGKTISWAKWLAALSELFPYPPVRFFWVRDREFLRQQLGKQLYWAFPLYRPPAWEHWGTLISQKAVDMGLCYRPAPDTARMLWEWRKSENSDNTEIRTGLPPSAERALLDLWLQTDMPNGL